jgi:hypothetical protein
VIWESAPWKDHLEKDAAIVHRWAAKPAISIRRSFLFERKAFLAAYAMRRLLEARKLSSEFERKTLNCKVYPAYSDIAVTSWNAENVDGLYNFAKPIIRATKIRDLINMIVHSLVFCEVLRADKTIQGFFVTSDYKSSNLWFIKLKDFIAIMRRVAHDYPAVIIRVRDPDTHTWTEWRGHRRRPPKTVDHEVSKNYAKADGPRKK